MDDSSDINLPPNSIAGGWIRTQDDWSGLSDARERRRIQNRRNQRIRRSKRRREVGLGACDGTEGQQLVPASSSSNPPIHWRYEDSDLRAVTAAVRALDSPATAPEDGRTILQRFEAFAHQLYITRAPQVTILPILSQFNFIRALLANMDLLGLSSENMDNDALSPFNSPAPVTRLPGGLRPTDLQRTTSHHPWIDLIPIPEMRDNLFRRGLDCFDEKKLCHALRGCIPSHDPGMLIWREPWDPSGWEVTESFIRTWGWALAGCWGLLHSTNACRAERGEKPLSAYYLGIV
ncbi:hypothetical protein AK830_g3380 [Neonectria ditissima]|uniref:BZIP domain-containing protein n=1 Tax=Neonectria ditissima TaxID=78410 RepID=A0A0P7B8V0_9HYPO|nr:hypothetical protein AK830_g3380 [Neonectria ditissima]